MVGYYKCPNNGEVIHCYPGDDKVLCKCGLANPILSPGLAKIEVRDRVHYTIVLDETSREEWLKQEDQKLEEYRRKKAMQEN